MDPTTNQDQLILFLPLVALLLFGYFHMDEIFEPKKHGPSTPRPARPSQPVADPTDASVMTDPDGRPWS
jgi:hypothetical protein